MRRIALLLTILTTGHCLQVQAQTNFVASKSIPFDGNPISVTNADFDRNGLTDFAVAFADSIIVFLANGKGDFNADAKILVEDAVTSILAADISGDGFTDLLYCSANEDAVYIFLADGHGDFHFDESIQVGDSPRELLVADLDSNDILDVVVVNQASDNISVLMGRLGEDYLRTDYDVGDGPKSVALFDFNADSKDDLVTANSISDDVTVLSGNGDGIFSNLITFGTGNSPQKVRVGNFNEDDFIDIVTVNQLSNEIHLTLGDGTGGILSDAFFDAPSNPIDLVVGNFDEDKNLDVISLNSGSDNTTLFGGDGSGSLSVLSTFSTNGSGIDFDAVDLNEDLITDLILVDFSSGSVNLLYGGANGQFGPQINPITSTADFPQGIVSGDFDQDGYVDIAVSHDPLIGRTVDQVSIFLNDGSGRFGARHLFKNVGENPEDLEVADFNDDGIPDLISAVPGDDLIALLIGDGTGNFAVSNIAMSGDSRQLATGHLNDDQLIDIVGTPNSSDLNIFFGDGIDGELSRLTLSTGGFSNNVAVADVNGDDLNDILASNCCTTNNSKVSIFLNEGGGNFQLPTTILEGIDPEVLELGDVNGDDHLDLVVMGNFGDVSIALGDGEGGFSLLTTIQIDNPRSMKLMDLTGDGALDFLVTGVNEVFLFQGKGDGNFELLQSYITGGQSQFITVADYNNDQKVDFAISNATTDDFYVYLNNTNDDIISPEVNISSNIASLEAIQSIEISFNFSEEIKGFNSSDIILENGVIEGDIVQQNDQQFSANVRPLGEGQMIISINENELSDFSGNGNLKSNVLSIQVGFNEIPSNITLNNSSIEENRPVGTLIGVFSTIDSDVGDIHTYSLITGTGDSDNDQFSITGNQLLANATFDFETQSNYSIRVQTNDGNGGTFEKSFAIQVEDVNENQSPSDIELSNNSIEENAPKGTTIGMFNTVDSDIGDTHTYLLVLGAGDSENDQFTINKNELISNEIFDFETQSTYSIRVQTNDGNGGIFEKPFVLNISDVDENQSPTDLELSGNEIEENQPVGTMIGVFSTVDADPADTHTYSLVTSAGDADNDRFLISNNELRSNAIFDFETQSNYTIRVQTDDGNGGTFEKSFVIQVQDLNENLPTDIELSGIEVEENKPIGTKIGMFTAIDADPADTYTYAFIAGTGDADNNQFLISNDELLSNAIFDFETQSNYTIRVRADDGNEGTLEKSFTIQVVDVNENQSPTDIGLSNDSFEENQPIGTTVGVFTTVDADAEDTHTYSLVIGAEDVDNELFLISNDELLSNAILDFETQSNYTIRVQTDDGNGGMFEKSFGIQVEDVDENQTPTDLELSGDEIEENQPVGTTIGVFTTVDDDLADTHSYSLVTGIGDTDNDQFTISNNQLLSNATFDYERQPDYTIRVQTDDGNGGTFAIPIPIFIVDIEEDVLTSAAKQRKVKHFLYPNPSKNTFQIFFEGDELQRKLLVRIYDSRSQLIFEEKGFLDGINLSLQVERFQSGSYFLIIVGDAIEVSEKVIIR